MTENRKNWLYPEASGLYFPHDGFVMRALDGKQYDIEEECELLNEYHRGYNECRDDVLRLEKENEQLKKVLGAILLEVKRDISNTNQTGEIRVFINPNSFNLISEVLRKYGALKEWYE